MLNLVKCVLGWQDSELAEVARGGNKVLTVHRLSPVSARKIGLSDAFGFFIGEQGGSSHCDQNSLCVFVTRYGRRLWLVRKKRNTCDLMNFGVS